MRAGLLVLASCSMSSPRLSLILSLGLATVLTAAPPRPEDTWPGFRGHALSGIAPGGFVPERWSVSENVRWKIDVPGRGWSSPIVWGDTLFLTSAISSKPFKQPLPGLYGNDYIAELRAQGVPGEEINRRVRARDIESSAEADRIRYMVYAVDAASGKIRWEREAHTAIPPGGRHRKNTYASETPFTDGERVYASFGQNVGLFIAWRHPRASGYTPSGVTQGNRVFLVHDTGIMIVLDAVHRQRDLQGPRRWRRSHVLRVAGGCRRTNPAADRRGADLCDRRGR